MAAFSATVKAMGRRLKELRKVRGWSQERLAGAAEISRTHMGAIEIGARVPSLWTLFRLAHALDVAIAEVFLVPASFPAAPREIVARLEAKLLEKGRTVEQLRKVEDLVDAFLKER